MSSKEGNIFLFLRIILIEKGIQLADYISKRRSVTWHEKMCFKKGYRWMVGTKENGNEEVQGRMIGQQSFQRSNEIVQKAKKDLIGSSFREEKQLDEDCFLKRSWKVVFWCNGWDCKGSICLVCVRGWEKEKICMRNANTKRWNTKMSVIEVVYRMIKIIKLPEISFMWDSIEYDIVSWGIMIYGLK